MVRNPLFKDTINGKIPNAFKVKNKSERKAQNVPNQLPEDNSNFQQVQQFVDSISEKEQEQIISHLLVKRADDYGLGRKNFSTALSQRHGKALQVYTGVRHDDTQPTIPVSAVAQIQIGLNLSQNQTLGMAAMLRS